MPASYICALYYGGHHKKMAGQDMILQPVYATQGIAWYLEGQNSSLSATLDATQVQWLPQSYQMTWVSDVRQYIVVNKRYLSIYQSF